MEKVTRFSGADWASETKEIMIVGQGGIGSWLSLNLSRIGHHLYIIDDDVVDQTNVSGGQMFKRKQVGIPKCNAVTQVCREFGCDNVIDPIISKFTSRTGCVNIMLTGLDNMASRRETFEEWRKHINRLSVEQRKECLFVDGRLTIEMWEIFAIKGNDEKAMDIFEENHLFSDEESIPLECSTKQSTFAAMSIAGSMTSTLCNFLTNVKLNDEVRTVPFHQRMYFPINLYEIIENNNEESSISGVVENSENLKTETVNE